MNARAVGSGVLMGMGLWHPYLWPLTALGIYSALGLLEKPSSRKQAFLTGWIIGSAKALVALVWFWSVYPVDWLGFSPGPAQIVVIALYWIPAGLVLGLGLAGLFCLYHHYRSVFEKYWFFLVPGGWLLGELLGSLAFSIAAAGPGSSPTIGFSFGWVGYALGGHEFLVQLARFGGVFILTPLLVVIVLFIKKYQPALFIIPATVAFLATGYLNPISFPVTFTPKEQSVAFFETRFPALSKNQADEYTRRFLEYQKMAQAGLATGADYIIFPEDARFTTTFKDSFELRFFLNRYATNQTTIIDTLRYDPEAGAELQAVIHQTTTQQPTVFTKQYLVPQGEYIPYIYQGLLRGLSAFTDIRPRLTGMSFRPGVAQQAVVHDASIPPVLFCFESVTPLGVRSIVKNRDGVPFVAHVVSHAWFQRNPEIFRNQLDAMLKVQAVWNQVPIVQAANESPAKIYLPDGTIFIPAPQITTDEWTMFVVTL